MVRGGDVEPLIGRLGLRSLKIWRELLPNTPFNGSLVVAHARDRSDFERFARLTSEYRRLDAAGVGELEPSLEGRFREGLFYPDEGHVEPRRVLPELHARIIKAGGTIKFNSEVDTRPPTASSSIAAALARANRAGAARRQG